MDISRKIGKCWDGWTEGFKAGQSQALYGFKEGGQTGSMVDVPNTLRRSEESWAAGAQLIVSLRNLEIWGLNKNWKLGFNYLCDMDGTKLFRKQNRSLNRGLHPKIGV